jgi:hypothetical protein
VERSDIHQSAMGIGGRLNPSYGPTMLESLRRLRKLSGGQQIRPRRFTRAKAPRTPSSETSSFAAFASLREIFRISVAYLAYERGS